MTRYISPRFWSIPKIAFRISHWVSHFELFKIQVWFHILFTESGEKLSPVRSMVATGCWLILPMAAICVRAARASGGRQTWRDSRSCLNFAVCPDGKRRQWGVLTSYFIDMRPVTWNLKQGLAKSFWKNTVYTWDQEPFKSEKRNTDICIYRISDNSIYRIPLMLDTECKYNLIMRMIKICKWRLSDTIDELTGSKNSGKLRRLEPISYLR